MWFYTAAKRHGSLVQQEITAGISPKLHSVSQRHAMGRCARLDDCG